MNFLVRLLLLLAGFWLLSRLWTWFRREGWKKLLQAVFGKLPETPEHLKPHRGALVRCRTCGTHVDAALAVPGSGADDSGTFCSEECRARNRRDLPE